MRSRFLGIGDAGSGRLRPAAFAGLVDIGDHRKIYLEMQRTGIADRCSRLRQRQSRRRVEHGSAGCARSNRVSDDSKVHEGLRL